MSNSSENNVVKLIKSIPTNDKPQGYLAFYGYWWGGMTDCDYQIMSYSANKKVLTLDIADSGYANYQFTVDITAPMDAELLTDALVIWQAESLAIYCKSDQTKTAPHPEFYRKYKTIEEEIYYASSDDCDYYKPVVNQPAFEIAWHVPLGAEKVCYRERGKVRVPPGLND